LPPTLHKPTWDQWRATTKVDAPACIFVYNPQADTTLLMAGEPVKSYPLAQALAISRGMDYVIDLNIGCPRYI
jgi:hypothetical protein